MTMEHFECPNCGPHVAADEDGCCSMCGQDTVATKCDCLSGRPGVSINLDLLCDIFKYASDSGFHVVHETEERWGDRLEIAANHVKKACIHSNASLSEVQINELARCLFGFSKGMKDLANKTRKIGGGGV